MNKFSGLMKEAIQYIDEKEVIKLTKELIKIPSENPPGKMDEITNYVCNYLDNNNLNYEVINAENDEPIIISKLTGNSDGKTLVLNGHLDVVPAGNKEKWDFPPFLGEIRNGYICGRGASDMKTGVACLLAAFKAASKLPELPGNVILMLVPDEETGGHNGTGWIVENYDLSADGCLIAEPSRDNPTVGQKGSCWLKVITRGKPGHGSLSPLLGDNAIIKMNNTLNVIYRIWEKDWDIPEEIIELINDSKRIVRKEQGVEGIEKIFDHVTVNAGIIKGGDKVNKIPDYCEAEMDLRIPFGVKTGEVIDFIKNELETNNIDAEIKLLRWSSEANHTLPETDIVQSVLKCARDITGNESIATLQWASSDARYFRNNGIPTIQYGPAELEGIHSYNEKVSVKDLKLYAQVYAAVIVDFLSS